MSRKTVFLQNGGLEEDFIDVEPWTKPAQGQVAEPAADDGAPKGSGVKEHVLKMASLLDQSDESELMPPGREKVQEWVQRYITVMGAPPEEEEEATDAQLAALYKRTIVLKQAPYCDFSVWTPYGRRALRSQKFRTFAPLGNGEFLMKELPGPQNFLQWLASWRVLKVAAISLNIASLSSLQQYEKCVERLTLHWPQTWGLIAQAEDKGRAEKLEKIRRGLVADELAGKAMPAEWDAENPWSLCLKMLSKDEAFWSEQVRHPASAWLAAGGRGAPLAPAETIAATHLPGGSDVLETSKEDVDRKRQSNKDRRAARKKRLRDDREELQRFRTSPSSHGQAAGKGSSKGKSKDKGGAEICYSWAQGKGPCAEVHVGGECKGKIKRAHKCQHCLSPGHKNDACPQK